MTPPDPIEQALEETDDGVAIRLRAQPGARKNAISGVRSGELLVAVTAPPDKGRANEAIVKLLAKSLRISKKQVYLVSGLTNRHKRVCVSGMSRENAAAALRIATD